MRVTGSKLGDISPVGNLALTINVPAQCENGSILTQRQRMFIAGFHIHNFRVRCLR